MRGADHAAFLLRLATLISSLVPNIQHASSSASPPARGPNAGGARGGAGLTLLVYNNSGLAGLPVESRPVDSLNFSVAPPAGGGAPLSAELIGTVTVTDEDGPYEFTCDFGAATVAFMFVDDHMVCQTGAYSSPPSVTTVDNPLRKLSKSTLPVRLEVYYSSDPIRRLEAAEEEEDRGTSSVDVGVTVTSRASASDPSWRPTLSPRLPDAEGRRRELQRGLLAGGGWGPWNHDTLLDMVHLPSGATITAAICRLGSSSAGGGSCAEVARPDDNARAGVLAYDRSFGQFFVHNTTVGPPLNVSFRFSGGEDLMMAVDLLSGSGGSYALVVFGGVLWHRVADVSAAGDALILSPWGMPDLKIYAASDPRDHSAAEISSLSRRMKVLLADDARPHLILPLLEGRTVGLSSGGRMPVSDIAAALDAREAAEVRRYGEYGELAIVKAAAQAAVMWNLVYVPAEAGPIAPVSRGWGGHLCFGATSREWCYVTFDWDNIFASYILSLDAKDIAYSNFIQVIKSKTRDGFVPNVADATYKSEDHTEPPVGSKVLLEMYRKYGDKWIVELLFDDLLDWNNWFLAKRTTPPSNLIVLGGDTMQNARFESGLDNSPMYDGEDFFDNNASHMLLYDVGMSSMVAMEAEALAELADAISRPESRMLRERSESIRRSIAEELWDAEYGAFVNRFVNGSFYRRISPTSFYPMLTGAASAAQVDEMMTRWMFNSSRFCLSAKGDFAGNSDDCYWGLPSISADDPAYLKGWVYWRGFVWGPMAQLVYWGLRRYDSVPSARAARRSLCGQMTSMMMRQWDAHGHICENYGPRRDTDDCTGNKFYHWGALAGFISLLEDGYYNSSGRAGGPKSD